MTILEVLDLVLRDSESLSLDSPTDRKRLRDNFEHLMRSQRPEAYFGENLQTPLYRLDHD